MLVIFFEGPSELGPNGKLGVASTDPTPDRPVDIPGEGLAFPRPSVVRSLRSPIRGGRQRYRWRWTTPDREGHLVPACRRKWARPARNTTFFRVSAGDGLRLTRKTTFYSVGGDGELRITVKTTFSIGGGGGVRLARKVTLVLVGGGSGPRRADKTTLLPVVAVGGGLRTARNTTFFPDSCASPGLTWGAADFAEADARRGHQGDAAGGRGLCAHPA